VLTSDATGNPVSDEDSEPQDEEEDDELARVIRKLAEPCWCWADGPEGGAAGGGCFVGDFRPNLRNNLLFSNLNMLSPAFTYVLLL
jgi:hypothetical protein